MKVSSLKKDLIIKHINKAIYELETINKMEKGSIPEEIIEELKYTLIEYKIRHV